ncbi:hypothetical protein LJR269_006595 [Duganella sp. LjRoot269]
MRSRMLAIRARTVIGLSLVAGCSTSSSEHMAKHATPGQLVSQAISPEPIQWTNVSLPHSAEIGTELEPLGYRESGTPQARPPPYPFGRTIRTKVAPRGDTPQTNNSQGNLEMENSKANTTAVQLQAPPVSRGKDDHAFDLTQIGIGGLGFAILYGAIALARRAAVDRKKKRADEALLAEERMQDAVRNAVAAQLDVLKKADATPATPTASTEPTFSHINNEGSAAQAEPPAAPHLPVPTDPEQPAIPVVSDVIEPVVEPVVDPRRTDPKYLAARRLLDALHAAERDVEPFLEMIKTANLPDDHDKHDAALRVIGAWHQCVQRTRNSLQEAFVRAQLHDELPSTPAPESLSDALARLYQHAAFFTSLLTVQQKPKSPILAWSKQLPGAVLQLYWHAQTHLVAKDIQAHPLPQLPEGTTAGRAPAAPPPDNGDFQHLLKKAIGGSHGGK